MVRRNNEEYHRYDDILHLPHHVSSVHPQMPLAERAAQFAPFAALTGHGDAIRETARITDAYIRLDEDSRESLDGKLSILQEHMDRHPPITITFFRPDARKEGGAYESVSGTVRKVDTWKRKLVLADGREVPMEYIMDMDSELFWELG